VNAAPRLSCRGLARLSCLTTSQEGIRTTKPDRIQHPRIALPLAGLTFTFGIWRLSIV